MDESTNSLDKDTEKKILSDVLSSSAKKIIILVSHNQHSELKFDYNLTIVGYNLKKFENNEVVHD